MAVSVPFLGTGGDLRERQVEVESFRRRGRKVLLKEAVVSAEARRRVGTHAARARGEVSGSTKKMYRQKGTGQARHGSFKAPQLRGGGVAFAKKPREFGWSIPKKARRAALEAAIRGKLEDGEVRVVEAFGLSKPRTKDFVAILGKLELDGSFLVVPGAHDDALWRSCRNVPGASYRVVADLNAYEVLRSKFLLMDEAALQALESRFGNA
jgi:large subunit ribosomal protein L4